MLTGSFLNSPDSPVIWSLLLLSSIASSDEVGICLGRAPKCLACSDACGLLCMLATISAHLWKDPAFHVF
jgi:hypothetical protein